MAYNISVKFPEAKDRWLWVSRGVELLRDEGLRHADERAALLAEEAGSLDERLHLRRVGVGERTRRGEAGEERRCGLVHARVGGLRRQHRGNEQLERVVVHEFRVRVRMLPGQGLDDATRGGGRLQWTGPLLQPTLEYDSENTRMCSCSAPMS